MKAILRNRLNGQEVHVTSSTDQPDSSYGQAVWVDDEGQAYCIVGRPNPLYDVVEMDIDDRETLGQYLRLLRVTQNISVRGMAERCELSPSTIQNIEKGAFTPRLDIITKMIAVLGKSLKITDP